MARVVCYDPRHNVTLAELDVKKIDDLLAVWQDQYRELGDRPEVDHVLVFENKGEVVGVSNPHPHCQIYATNFVFKTIEIEAAAAARHWAEARRSLMSDIIKAESEDGRRILVENDSVVAFIPYFARYAYETFVSPKQMHASLADLSAGGAGVLIDAPVDDVPTAGTVTTVSFRIPDASGAWRNVSALVQIAHVSPAGPDTTRVGLAFDEPTDAPLDPVVEFLTIDRRLVGFGRRNREHVGGV